MLHGRMKMKTGSHKAIRADLNRRQMCIFSIKPASELSSDISAKRISAAEVVKHHLDLIKANEERLGSFLHVDEEGALAQECFPPPDLA